jgi:gluconolactonase
LDGSGLFPNGLAFDVSGERLFVSESYARRIVSYRFDHGTLSDKRVIVDGIDGTPDGMALDADGNIWQCVNPADAIEVFSPHGQLLERVTTGEGSYPSNCCFAGPNMTTLYVTLAGTGGLAAFDVGTPGLPLYPFR